MAGQPWSKGEDSLLLRLYDQDPKLGQREFFKAYGVRFRGRSAMAIKNRLAGLITERNSTGNETEEDDSQGPPSPRSPAKRRAEQDLRANTERPSKKKRVESDSSDDDSKCEACYADLRDNDDGGRSDQPILQSGGRDHHTQSGNNNALTAEHVTQVDSKSQNNYTGEVQKEGNLSRKRTPKAQISDEDSDPQAGSINFDGEVEPFGLNQPLGRRKFSTPNATLLELPTASGRDDAPEHEVSEHERSEARRLYQEQLSDQESEPTQSDPEKPCRHDSSQESSEYVPSFEQSTSETEEDYENTSERNAQILEDREVKAWTLGIRPPKLNTNKETMRSSRRLKEKLPTPPSTARLSSAATYRRTPSGTPMADLTFIASKDRQESLEAEQPIVSSDIHRPGTASVIWGRSSEGVETTSHTHQTRMSTKADIVQRISDLISDLVGCEIESRDAAKDADLSQRLEASESVASAERRFIREMIDDQNRKIENLTGQLRYIQGDGGDLNGHPSSEESPETPLAADRKACNNIQESRGEEYNEGAGEP